MNNQKLAPHELLDLHELLSFKNLCATKSSTMQGLIEDQKLKDIVSNDLNSTKRHIQDLQNVISSSEGVQL